MLARLNPRYAFAGIAAVIAVLFGVALYTQYVGGLEPCPLCMTQRFFYVLTALLAIVAALHGHGLRIYAVLVGLSALGGAGVAARQVWLQHLPPDQVPACGPSLEFMLQTLPFGQVLMRLFKGDGNCAVVDWRLLGMSMAAWSLLWFLLLATAGLVLFWRSAKR